MPGNLQGPRGLGQESRPSLVHRHRLRRFQTTAPGSNIPQRTCSSSRCRILSSCAAARANCATVRNCNGNASARGKPRDGFRIVPCTQNQVQVMLRWNSPYGLAYKGTMPTYLWRRRGPFLTMAIIAIRSLIRRILWGGCVVGHELAHL
jgi:hypothetical protein